MKGSTDKSVLGEAVVRAAASVGYDGKGKDGLDGYLRRLAKKQPGRYGQLLGRVLPYHITGEVGKSIENKDAKLYTREYLEKLSLHEVTDLYRQQIAEHAGIVP